MHQKVSDLTSHCDLVRHAWAELHAALSRADRHRLLLRRCDDVIGWVLGRGEELLATHDLIGRDVTSSERLIELHDQAELQCRVSERAWFENGCISKRGLERFVDER